MMGRTHFAIGMAAGAALVTYGVKTNQPVYAFGMITAPLGAMLPDIDHANSKLGRVKNKALRTIDVCFKVATFVLCAAIVLSIYNDFVGLKVLIPALAVMVMYLLITSDTMKQKFKFLLKHRGIMHTLVIPLLIIVFNIDTDVNIAKSLMIGVAVGYMSHLLADSITLEGCPTAFPFSTKSISLAGIKTNTTMEYVGAVIVSALMLYSGIMCSKDMVYISWLLIWWLIAIGSIVTKPITRLLKSITHKSIHSVVVTACFAILVGIAYLIKNNIFIIITVGLFVGSIKACFNK